MLIYGAYENVRDAAWQFLIDFEISQLPISLSEISKKSRIKLIKNENVNVLAKDELGISLLEENQWYIIYNEKLGIPKSRFTIAHEFGHIFLGHKLKAGYHARTKIFDKSKPAVETEADVFAARILAPACVLWGLNLHTPEDIAKVCNITDDSSEIRAVRMKILYKRNMFLKSPLERTVFKQFEEFIIQMQKGMH